MRWLFLGVLLQLAASAGHAAASPEHSHFPPRADPVADIDATLAKAGGTGRLALVVLGADWCHDSRALARRIAQAPLSDLIAERYETVLVDVGYLDLDAGVLDRLGLPIYYATPTVLILDPANESLVNASDRHRWATAAEIGMQESLDYFRRMAEEPPVEPGPAESPVLRGLLADIEDWERRMAGRVRDGYAQLGPLLAAYKTGGPVPGDFDAQWEELAAFRLALPEQVAGLRQEARRRARAGQTDIRLALPAEPVFSWEERP